jgi:putative ABC transport system permease protein
MLAVALKGLAGRKLRAALTAIAIVLGVAMISGTYVLTDTINSGFSTIYSQSYQNADVVISGKAAFDNANGTTVEPPPLPQSLLPRVQSLPDVALAAGSVSSNNVKLIGKDGKAVSSGGAPTLGFSVTTAGQIFNPTKLTEGRWPHGSSEVVVDKESASSQGFHVGDRIGVQGFGPIQRMRLVGIATFPGVSIGGATFAVFDQPTAQALFNKPRQLDAIRVKSKSGVSTAEMISQIKPLLSPNQVVRSGTAQAKKDQHDQVSGFLSFLRYALLAFAAISLFVGAFVIANTLAITIAQRTREFATLRTLGASRRQVLRSVVVEALVIGILGSVVGLFLGLALAKGLQWLFVQIGIDLPTGSTVFATRTVVVALLVGTIVTLLASIRPARRATRVPPIAAVREGSVIPPSRWAKYGPVTSLVVLVIGIVMVSLGALGSGIATGPRLLLLGLGVLVLFIGVSMNASKVVRPLAAVLGAPTRTIGGAPGILARDNATRNPARTASTASALMIGLALVTFVAIFGQGIRSSFEDAVNKLFVADYALTSTSTFNPIEAQAGQALVGKPGVHDVTAIRAGSARYLGSNNDLTAVQPNLNRTVEMDWTQGSNATPGRLGLDGFFASDNYVKDHDLSLGTPVTLQFPSGRKTTVRLKGTWDEPKGGSPFAHITISTALFDKFTPRPQDEMVLMNTPGGVSDANTARLDRYVAGFADAKIQTRDEFKTNFEAPINNLLNLLYALLALSVIISLVGIINTLVLTVFERTRELGMLRAVGMTRRQVRMMIRYESIVTSLMGATLGMVVGIFLAALITHALSNDGIVFAVPWIQIVYFVIAAIIVGILAAVIPARRAARLNVLQALQYE